MDQEQGNIVTPQSVSKRQLKKQERKLKQKENYKQQKLLKKQIKKQNPLPPPLPNPEIQIKKPKKNRELYKEQMKQGLTVIIDLQFLNLMNESDKISLYKQIELCHSINYKSDVPLNLVVTSVDEQFMQLIDKSNGSKWGITLEQKHYLDLFEKEQLIYLTGDTKDELKELVQEDIYIIGGLVDHNHLKQITLNKANEQGLKTRRLPINIELKTSSILTVNQVFEILLRVKNNETFDQAVNNAIPKRKLK